MPQLLSVKQNHYEYLSVNGQHAGTSVTYSLKEQQLA